jgi:hypothetical protein
LLLMARLCYPSRDLEASYIGRIIAVMEIVVKTVDCIHIHVEGLQT